MKRKVALILIIIVSLVVAACGKTSEKSNGEAEKNGSKEPFKIGFSALPSWYMWYLVEKKGFFKKHGVDVKLVYFPVYADSLTALNTGKIDGNSQALIDSIAPLENDIGLKTAFITDNSTGGDGIVATKDIKSIEDLKGKTIGTEIGTIEHFFMLTAFEKAGLKESDVKFSNLAVQDAGTSFIAGKLDSAGLWEPFLSMAEKDGGGHKLITSADFPGLIADIFAVREEVAGEREEDIRKITAAWFDAVQYYSENEDESKKVIADAAGITVDELAEGMAGFDLFTKEQNFAAFEKDNSYKSIEFTAKENAKFLKKQDFIKKVPDLKGLLDLSYLEKMIK